MAARLGPGIWKNPRLSGRLAVPSEATSASMPPMRTVRTQDGRVSADDGAFFSAGHFS